ncbi:PadR family transcriptional regulator [Paenibacillus puerhi]|uniref:PadR family transcriptional regulator n=1 Tax=Paenibacillus puerhi TaxID=2692622 RepID=UPI0013583010|nr:PadR family transcriptional regulator [Paenibacillus puerhi]
MKINKELLKGTTATMILTLLTKQTMYGYELVKELEARSDGAFSLKEGTLYPLLHAMEAEGLVEASWFEADGRKRKYYHITNAGRSRLEDKKAEWIFFRKAMDQVLGEGKA